MSLLTLDEIKDHLHVSYADEDANISAYQATAEAWVVNRLDRAVFPVGGAAPANDDGTAIELTPEISHAVKLLVAHYFSNREAVSDVKFLDVPFTVKSLLAPFRVWRQYIEI